MEATGAKEPSMTHKELIQNLELELKEMIAENERLKHAALQVVKAFQQPQDYHVWDEALNILEAALKGEKHG